MDKGLNMQSPLMRPGSPLPYSPLEMRSQPIIDAVAQLWTWLARGIRHLDSVGLNAYLSDEEAGLVAGSARNVSQQVATPKQATAAKHAPRIRKPKVREAQVRYA